MAIEGNQILDPNNLDCGLPVDTCCVGMGGPTPMEAALISKQVAKSAVQTGGKIPTMTSGLTGGN